MTIYLSGKNDSHELEVDLTCGNDSVFSIEKINKVLLVNGKKKRKIDFDKIACIPDKENSLYYQAEEYLKDYVKYINY